MGIPSENENESMEEVCVINKNSLCILKNKHDQKENKPKKKMMFIYEKKRKKMTRQLRQVLLKKMQHGVC